MLDANLTAQLKTILNDKIVEPIELVSSLDDRPKSTELAEMLDQIASLSDKVTHRRADDDERRPSFAISRPGTDISVRFAGIPMGHEFSSLVLALVQVGGNPVKEDEETMEAVRNLDGDYEFVTYMSLTCQNCPTVVQALNAMAVLNPRIKHTAVEGSLFQDEVEERRILAVPTIYLNGEEWGSGRTDMKQFVERLDHHAAARTAGKLNEREPYDVLVVGGGPAGSAAAIYAARKGIRTGMACDRVGGQVLDTMAIENHVSTVYTEGPKLGAQYAEHMNAYEIDQIAGVQASRLVPGTDGELHTVEFEGGGRLQARQVIIATGARWRTLGVPGEADYRNKGVSFCPHCDGPLFKGKPIAVVGGGNSGVEAAIDLAGVTEHVTVVEFMDELKADDVLLRKLYSLPNTEVITSARTTQVNGDGQQMTGLEYEDRQSGEIRTLDVDGVFVQIGLLPNTEWLKDSSLELTPRGEIRIDERNATNIPGIFAAGDCTTVPFKQIVVAEGSGATAALSAFDEMIRTTAPAAIVAS
ncbi:alkyl hydroperoxide reductase subunit F [Raineyella antarctica]|uniref:Alkyl hydroperoxide reductase subunit F n=1 Tax=Raineyella antarctica TaxID=1577474 RepID=A0A1G6H8T6_9ACTN|nr:alkyl hydroperoxide reductase subunit F [Raineyella antarctica]SDB89836.1 alkyl hydroperoxide reductase subunit F [Raineyella antarctica]